MRLHRMLDEDDPTFANWDQDETAVAERYGEQDAVTVGRDLVAAGTKSPTASPRSRRPAGRPGTRSDGACFTVETFARYLVHDPASPVDVPR